MDRVCERRETYLITKRGRRVAKLAPVDPPRRTGSMIGCLRGELEIAGDIVGSPASEEAWNETLREWDELNAGLAGKPRRRPRRR
jgi:antitoxin (DNA-binding transcriptional repressor) of toxin-antitoxin stability system